MPLNEIFRYINSTIEPFGLWAIAGAKLLGTERIFAIGTRPNCIELAKEYGATDIISYENGDIIEQIIKINGEQVDPCIIAGGDTSTLNQALMLTRVREKQNLSNLI
ncbi:zinc-binding dehydrogenase [Butyrivibrio sp. VCD2006]|uniref:zinc-binding dehydrogenase n=1 Tax=Butyrivibrio sp. VCD2006 TaxID=1280664 RepID=UPI0009DBF5D9